MFTGIIEELGELTHIEHDQQNMHLRIRAKMTPELQIDQSVAHNGVCLTVVQKTVQTYTVTAIAETLSKTNLSQLKVGAQLNLERGMKMTDRLDGHIVQGHVDQTGVCTRVQEQGGSHLFAFSYDPTPENITIEKGSITINGVSLTVVDSSKDSFSVAIIPYTFAHTTFKDLREGDLVNLEFDVIGKYVTRLHALYK